MKNMIFLFFFFIAIGSFAKDFDLFSTAQQKKRKSILLARHQFIANFSFNIRTYDQDNIDKIAPFKENLLGISYRYFLSKEHGIFFDILGKMYHDDTIFGPRTESFHDKMEFNIGYTYGINVKDPDFNFFINGGLSLNNSLQTKDKFSVNHVLVGFELLYNLSNDFAVSYFINGKMSFVRNTDEDLLLLNRLNFIYKLNI